MKEGTLAGYSLKKGIFEQDGSKGDVAERVNIMGFQHGSKLCYCTMGQNCDVVRRI